MNLAEKTALETIERTIINKMASVAGVAGFQMLSMINRNPELKAFYKKTRSEVVSEMAENFKA